MDTVCVSLGRNGDVLNTLRAIPLLNAKHGGPIAMMVSRPYVDILEGCSYVIREPFDQPFEAINHALTDARAKYSNVINAAVYGHNYATDRKTESFCLESWRLMGVEHAYWETPLIFDNRNADRESKLIANIPTEKPWLLLNLSGNSSPFQFASLVRQQLRKWRGIFEIIDLSLVTAERLYDLLAFYDRAALLITTDTATLHLAAASKVPTLAFITDKPTLWHGAAPTCNCPLKIRYSDYPNRQKEVDALIESIIRVPVLAPVVHAGPKLIHIWSEYPATGDDARRYAFTKTTWLDEWRLANWSPKPLTDDLFSRSSKSQLKDVRRLPFIRDMVALGVEGANDDDVIVLTNNDTCFMQGIGKAILRDIQKSGCLWAHRWDFNRLDNAPSPHRLFDGQLYCGCDLFAFTVAWWKQHGHDYPDMVLASEAWDWIFRELVKLNRGVEWNTGIYHEVHSAFWNHPRNKNSNPSQLHNKRLAREFLTKHNLPQNGFSR